MARFGDLVNNELVLLCFYTEWNQASLEAKRNMNHLSRKFPRMKTISINCDKNQELTEALKVKNLPTLMLYTEGQFIDRLTDYNRLTELIEPLYKKRWKN